MAKLWQGAFNGASKEIISFNSSENIELDSELIEYDILGSVAHVKMLGKQGILSSDEVSSIIKALNTLLSKSQKGEFKLDPELEDVHTNVENEVTKLTPFGKKMHTARSRNDQALVDMRMYLRDKTLEISKEVVELQNSFVKVSECDGLMVGYTHTRVAQPILISYWADAYVHGLERDIERLLDCYKRINQNPLGACAISGTRWPIDREFTAKLLGFDSVQENELDSISSRGECEAELLSALSLLMTRLSGLAEELIWLSQKGLVMIPDELCTGSSIMPNKKNPDVLELIRARSARVQSNLVHVLSMKKGLISGYHSDMQESKYAVMQGVKTTLGCILVMNSVVSGISFAQEKIKFELEEGYGQATEIADALVAKGLSFREAHGIVGSLVFKCKEKGIFLSKCEPLAQFTKEEWKEITLLQRDRLKRKIESSKQLVRVQATQSSIIHLFSNLTK